MMTPNWERIWEARISKGSTPQSQDLSRRPCSTRVTWCIPNSNIPYFVHLLIVKLVSWHCSALLVLLVSCYHWVSSSPSISDLPSISKHISSSIPEPALRWKTRWWEPSRENISPAIPWKWLMLALFNDNDVLQSLTMPSFYRYFANSQRSPVFDEVWEQTVQMANNI